jgi:hypothetical protein
MDDHDFDPASGSVTDSGMDDQLMVELGRVVRMVDPVPEGVLAAARAVIASRDLDGELAALLADSGAPTSAGPVRTGASGRLLSFACGPVQIDLEITTGPDRLADIRVVDIIGQLSGGSADGCVLEYPGGRQPVALDGLGRFAVTGAPAGPVRIRCRSAAGAPVTTTWVTL